MKKRILSLMLAAFVLAMPICADASTYSTPEMLQLQSQIDEAKEKSSQVQKKLDEANSKKNALSNEADEISKDYNSIDSKISSLQKDINSTQTEIVTNANSMAILSEELSQVQEEKDSQYAAMKNRIVFLYEEQNKSLLVILMESRSFSDFLERVEYVSALASYDRDQLEAYQAVEEELTEKTEELDAMQESLSASIDNLSSQKSQMNDLLAQTGEELSAKQAEVDSAASVVDDYEEEMAEMEAYEASLQQQYDDAQYALSQQLGANTENTASPYAASSSEAQLLAALIEAEAGGEPYEGKIAVGSVVMNRVESSKFKQNTITDVIYAPHQFSPVASGRVAKILARGPASSCQQAANEVLNGRRNTNCLFFCTVSYANSKGITGTVIGNHCFY